MKFIRCDICDSFLPLSQTTKFCSCENIGGKYQENSIYADIFLAKTSSFATSRVVGVSNAVVMGYAPKDEAHVGDWNDYQLRIFVDGEEVVYDEVKKPIIPYEEYAELMARIFEIGGYEPDDIEISRETNGAIVIYKMKDGALIYLMRERLDVKEPMAVLAKLEEGFLTEVKIFAYKMR
jgi:hypothetical protein